MEFARHRQPPQEWVGPMDGWVAWMRVKGHSEATVEHWWYQVGDFARSSGKTPLEVCTGDIMTWINRGIGKEAMRSSRNAVASFFRWYQALGPRNDNPADLIPATKREKRKKPPATDEAAVRGLFHPDPRVRLMVRILNDTGMRRNEIAVAHSRDLVDDLLGVSLMVHGKGAKDRMVPLSEPLAKELKGLPDGYFFPGKVHGHICSDTVYRLVRDATGFTPHAFRRKFATETWKATNGDILRVQELLGHESLATTQTYVTASVEDLRDAIRALGAWRLRRSTTRGADPIKLLDAYGVPESVIAIIMQTMIKDDV